MTIDTSADTALASAISQVESGLRDHALRPDIVSFFDDATSTVSHIVRAPGGNACAIIDSVLDFDMPSGRIGHASAERLAHYVNAHGLQVMWVLETHVHADHLTAAPWLQRQLGG